MSEESIAEPESGSSLLSIEPDTQQPQESQADSGAFALNVFENGQVSGEFMDALPKEHKGVASFFQKYAGSENPLEATVKGIAGLQYMAGQKGLEKLPDDAPEHVKEEQRQLLAKLHGAPEKPEGYSLSKPESVPDSVYWPEGSEERYAEIFHKHGASPELVSELWAAHMEGLSSGAENAEAAAAAFKQEQMGILRSELGDNLDSTIRQATQMAATLDISNELITSAELVKGLAKMASLISEDRLIDGESNRETGQTYEEQAAEQAKLAVDAAMAGDDAGAEKHRREQSRFNRLHIEAQKRKGSV